MKYLFQNLLEDGCQNEGECVVGTPPPAWGQWKSTRVDLQCTYTVVPLFGPSQYVHIRKRRNLSCQVGYALVSPMSYLLSPDSHTSFRNAVVRA